MTIEETGKILAEICAIWPNFSKNRDAMVTTNVWQNLFADMTYEQVSAALVAFVRSGRSNGFAPDPGQLVNIINSCNCEDIPGELEAWGMVSRALRNGYYGYREEFAKLHPLIQEVIGEPEILRQWAVMDEREVETIIASNFQRSYRSRAENVSERILVPEDVRQKLRGGGLKRFGEVLGGMLPGGPETEKAEEAKKEDDRAVSFWEFARSRPEDAQMLVDFLKFIPGEEPVRRNAGDRLPRISELLKERFPEAQSPSDSVPAAEGKGQTGSVASGMS